jgi:UDP-2,3-diacylglucosamine hydrolase
MARAGGQRRIGILAGGGSLPREIADSLRARGTHAHIVAFRDEADADFSEFPVTWVYWGQVGAIVKAFKQARCTDIVIVGRVSRPDLGRLRPDFGLLAALATALRIVASGGDDSVLRGVTRFFENKGFRVVGPGDVAPELLIGEGVLGASLPTSDDEREIAHGLRLLEALSPYDVGQTVVISDDLSVEAIEGIEGTDAMLARVAERRRTDRMLTGPARGFLIKAPKSGQDMRVDLPAIGPDTVKNAAAANLKGLAVHAGHVLAADKKKLITSADTHGVCVVGVTREVEADAREMPDVVVNPSTSRRMPHGVEMLGDITPGKKFLCDAQLGVQVLQSLTAFDTGGGVVVTSGHVLGVETGEGVGTLCQRIAQRKQWGAVRWKRRRGTVVVRNATDVTRGAVDEISAAGFVGFAIVRGKVSDAIDVAALNLNATGLVAVIVDTADTGEGD